MNILKINLYPDYFLTVEVQSQEKGSKPELDKKAEIFLKDNKRELGNMKVSVSDGKLFYDIILKNGYTNGLAISYKN